MELNREKPITPACAHAVEGAAAQLMRLGITQAEVVETMGRALGMVRLVLEDGKAIPRADLYQLAESLWTKTRLSQGIAAETVWKVRSIMQDCADHIRRLPEAEGPRIGDAALP